MPHTRRTFLAASALAGGWALTEERIMAALEAYEPGSLTKDELPTPALLVDLDKFEANIQKMADHCKRAGCGFRPHAKTHKCPDVARRLVAAGALGISVATVPEAEAMVAGGIKGVLLTSPIVDPRKIARMIALRAKGAEVMLSVGHARQVELLAEAAGAAGLELNILIDLDVSDGRTGITPGGPALALAQQASRGGRLHVRGLQAYSGLSSHVVGFEERAEASRTALGKAVATKALLQKSGIDAGILSGGSTGTYNIDSAIAGVTELQVGSFVFMDANYRRIGGKDSGAIYSDFAPSLTVLATVVSTTHADRATIDAGIKAFSSDTAETPEAVGQPGLKYRRFGDEFGLLTAEEGAKLPKLGERLEFIVPHCDPTVNLYDRLYACRGDRVEAVWPILARRETSAS